MGFFLPHKDIRLLFRSPALWSSSVVVAVVVRECANFCVYAKTIIIGREEDHSVGLRSFRVFLLRNRMSFARFGFAFLGYFNYFCQRLNYVLEVPSRLCVVSRVRVIKSAARRRRSKKSVELHPLATNRVQGCLGN